MTDLHLRRATQADLPGLMSLYDDFSHRILSQSDLQNYCQQRLDAFMLVEKAGQVIGFFEGVVVSKFGYAEAKAKPPIFHEVAGFIHPRHRSAKIAPACAFAYRRLLRDLGFNSIFFQVAAGNAPMIERLEIRGLKPFRESASTRLLKYIQPLDDDYFVGMQARGPYPPVRVCPNLMQGLGAVLAPAS